MKEFKMRVWDCVEEEMIYDFTYFNIQPALIQQDRYIFSFNTGIKDMYKIELYTGDIIKILHNQKYTICSIDFIDGQIVGIKKNRVIYKADELISLCEYFERVGNIFTESIF